MGDFIHEFSHVLATCSFTEDKTRGKERSFHRRDEMVWIHGTAVWHATYTIKCKGQIEVAASIAFDRASLCECSQRVAILSFLFDGR